MTEPVQDQAAAMLAAARAAGGSREEQAKMLRFMAMGCAASDDYPGVVAAQWAERQLLGATDNAQATDPGQVREPAAADTDDDSLFDDPDGRGDGGQELDGVDDAVFSLLEADEPITEESLAAVGVSYEQYWTLVTEQESRRVEPWTQASDAASWSAGAHEDAYAPALDNPSIDVGNEPKPDPQRSWRDPVDPAHDQLDGEEFIDAGRDRIFRALTGLDPAEHDTRDLTDVVRTDWLEDSTPEETREYYRSDDYTVNRLGTQHHPLGQPSTAELVGQAVRAVDEHALPAGRTDAQVDSDDEPARAEQLNRWSAQDNAGDIDGDIDGSGDTDPAVDQ